MEQMTPTVKLKTAVPHVRTSLSRKHRLFLNSPSAMRRLDDECLCAHSRRPILRPLPIYCSESILFVSEGDRFYISMRRKSVVFYDYNSCCCCLPSRVTSSGSSKLQKFDIVKSTTATVRDPTEDLGVKWGALIVSDIPL